MSFGKYAIVIKEPFGRLVRGGTSLCHKVEVMEEHMLYIWLYCQMCGLCGLGGFTGLCVRRIHIFGEYLSVLYSRIRVVNYQKA